MAVNKDFEDLLQCLNQEKAEFLIVGAYAVIFYTEPRYTKDIDLWINPAPENAQKVYRALKKFGAPVQNIAPDDLANKDLVYQIGVEPNRIDFIMDIAGLDYKSAAKSPSHDFYGKEKVFILNLKDLIKAKKASGRPQDLLDLAKLKKVKLKKG